MHNLRSSIVKVFSLPFIERTFWFGIFGKLVFEITGKEVEGEYHLHEPGGNVRSVKYHSDPHGGFFAEVHNYGGNDHSGGTYGGHKHG